jgi:glycosyltransferase involved in cell wall biosynthesis/polysaccharide pyruvyl transferase WcaK-like protein
MQVSTITLFYGHVASNLGDLAINQGEISLLRKVYPAARIKVVLLDALGSAHLPPSITSFPPLPDVELVHFESSSRDAFAYVSNPPTFLERCEAECSDIVALSSGEHLFAYDKNENAAGLFWRVLPILAAKAAGKCCIVLPSTLGPFDSDESTSLMRAALRLVDAYSVRDCASSRLMADLLNEQPLDPMLDPAFFIDLCERPSRDGPEGCFPQNQVMGVVVRSEAWGIRISGSIRSAYSALFKKDSYRSSQSFMFYAALCREYLEKHSGSIVIYVQTIADRDISQTLYDTLLGDGYGDRVELRTPSTVGEYIDELSKVGVVVTSRLHAAILSMAVETPVVGIYFESHGHKMPGMFEMLAASEQCYNLTKTPPNTAAQDVLEVLPRLGRSAQVLGERIQRWKRLTVGWLSDISSKPADSDAVLVATKAYADFGACVIPKIMDNEVSRQLEPLRTEIDRLKERHAKEIDRLKGRHAKETEQLHHRSSKELQALRQSKDKEIRRLRREKSDIDRARKELSSSLSFRLGRLIVRDARRPHHWPLFPLKAFVVYRKAKWQRVAKNRSSVSRKKKESQLDLLKKLDTTVASDKTPSSVPERVCYVLHNSLPYASGGYASRSHGVASGLRDSGFEVVAVTRPGFPHDTMDVDVDDVRGHVFDRIRYTRIHEPRRKGLSTARYMEEIIPVFREKFLELRPSVVVAASFYITALPALIAARELRIPFIYEIRGLGELTKLSRDSSYGASEDYKVRERMEAETAKKADAVFTLTRPMLEEFVRRGVDRDKITLLPNSCDPERFKPRPRDKELAQELGIPQDVVVIGYIGTIVDYEGLDDLVRACSALKGRGVVFRLVIVGSETSTGGINGPVTTELHRLAAEGGLGDWLITVGRVPHDRVEGYYSLIDVVPFPRKPWPVCEMVSPMKPLEALAMEKAVVVSSVRALNDMVATGETGLVFDKGNVESLAEALQKLVEDPQLRRSLGKSGRRLVETERNWRNVGRVASTIIKQYAPERQSARPRALSQEGGKRRRTIDNFKASALPAWWRLVPESFAKRCAYVYVPDWPLSAQARELKGIYIDRFGLEAVARRIPESNWKRADICWHKVPSDMSLLDIGSGLGEFVNLFASNNTETPITSVDNRDYSLWFDNAGHIERVYEDLFDLSDDMSRDVVTAFEIIEHLPPERLREAVDILRRLAKKQLYISVPFMEGPPLYKGHFTRFTSDNLLELFPDADFTVFGKNSARSDKVVAWILCELNGSSVG